MGEPQQTWVRGDLLARFVIPGEPAAKGNSRKIVVIKGRPALIKSAKGLAFEAIAGQRCPKWGEPYEGSVAVWTRAFYKNRQSDLDASLVYDAMQSRKIKVGPAAFVIEKRLIVNDRQVELKIEERFIDKVRPRVEVFVYKASLNLVGGAA